MTVQWFGPIPFSAACDPDNRCYPINGTPCAYCGEPIYPLRDSGYAVPHLSTPARTLPDTKEEIAAWLANGNAPPQTEFLYRFQHYECHSVSLFGHVRCVLTHGPGGVCEDGVDRDPPGMPLRQAALLAERIWQEERSGLLTRAKRINYLRTLWPGVPLPPLPEAPGVQWLGHGEGVRKPRLWDVWGGGDLSPEPA